MAAFLVAHVPQGTLDSSRLALNAQGRSRCWRYLRDRPLAVDGGRGADAADPTLAPVVGIPNGSHLDAFGRGRRDKLAFTEVDADVTNPGARGLVEDEVTALEALSLPDALVAALLAKVELIHGRAREVLAVAVEGPTSESRTVEPRARGPTVTIWGTDGTPTALLDVFPLLEGVAPLVRLCGSNHRETYC